jgi:DNA-binding transcriptional regulator/RsmH inhibitor MraZ
MDDFSQKLITSLLFIINQQAHIIEQQAKRIEVLEAKLSELDDLKETVAQLQRQLFGTSSERSKKKLPKKKMKQKVVRTKERDPLKA